MHRVILNTPTHIGVDHINGNPLDNRKVNLRLATRQQNQFNRRHQKNNKLGVKGVCWCRRAKKYRSTIKLNRKVIHLGYFPSLEEADKAYRDAEVKYFGSFARNERGAESSADLRCGNQKSNTIQEYAQVEKY